MLWLLLIVRMSRKRYANTCGSHYRFTRQIWLSNYCYYSLWEDSRNIRNRDAVKKYCTLTMYMILPHQLL